LAGIKQKRAMKALFSLWSLKKNELRYKEILKGKDIKGRTNI